MNSLKECEKQDKILLVLAPFWTPVIPPMGIACLQGYLKQHSYIVRSVDANIEVDSREFYEGYFDTLKTLIPENKRGNFYNTGRELLRNHMMAELNHTDQKLFIHLVQDMVYKNYYVEINEDQVLQLSKIIKNFYLWLETYITALLEKEKPTVLGLSVYNGTLPASLFTFKLAKKLAPHIHTVMGGGVFADQLSSNSPNLDYFLEQTVDYIDHLIIGEGEILFHKLLTGTLPPGRRVFTREDINQEILELSSVQLPHLADFDLEKYPYLVSYTSRSCPFQCSFCSETVQWGHYRKKSPQQIVEELKKMHHQYGYQLFLMCDSLINPVITPLAQECIQQELSIYWESCIRGEKEVCNTDNTLMWRQGGFYKARIGVESGSQRVLDLMNKKTTRQQIKEAVSSLAYAGIKTLTFWIIGHPGETEEDFQQSLDFLEELKDDIYEAEGTPFYYFLTGQSNSDGWMSTRQPLLLYPENAREMLITPTWILNGLPSREATYQRVNRFINHLDKLGIPHPYTMQEIIAADERWQKLHINAAPPLSAYEYRGGFIDENKHVKHLPLMLKTIEDDGNFGF